MDRNLRIRMLLEASDRVTRPLRDIAGGSSRAAQALKATRDRLKEINRAQADVGAFRQLKAGLRTTEDAMQAAKVRAGQLGRELGQTANPTRRMTREFERARAEALHLENQHQAEGRQLQQLRDRLRAAGVATGDLARHERELRDRASSTNRELAEQERRLREVTDRQRRMSQARDSFARTQGMATGIAAGGASGVATGMALGRPLLASVGDAQEYQSVMTDIAQKGDLSRVAGERLGRGLLAAAQAANQMPADMQRGVDTLAGLGASVPDSAIMMPSIGKASTAYKADVADLANATFAVKDNLKVAASETGRTLDIMAKSGKRGAFEVKDMAAAFPALTAAYQGLGQKGLPAVADLAAGLQIMRRGAGDSATAGTNMANVLQKIASPATNRAFAKMGVDLPAALQRAYKEGKTPLEAIAELTQKTLKGDLSKLGYLFEDAQVQQGLRPLIQNLEDYRKIRAEAGGAVGTTDADFAERMKDTAEQTKKLKVNAQVLSISLGTLLLPAINRIVQRASVFANWISRLAQRHPGMAKAVAIGAAALAILFLVLGAGAIVIAAIMGPIAILNAGLIAMGVAGGTASIGLLPIIGTILAVVAAVAGFAAIAYAIYSHWGAIAGFFGRLWGEIKAGFSGGLAGIAGLIVNFNPVGLLYRGFAALMGFLGVSMPAKLTDAGRWLIQGLINGITGQLSALKKTVVGAATSAATWFKNKLGIRSPSRVFMGFGGFMMQGLTSGIARGADEPVRRIDRLSRSLTGAMSSAPLRLPGLIADEDAPARRIDGLSRRLTAVLAVGSALPAVASATAAATPAGPRGMGVTAPTPAPIMINVYGAPGQNEEALAAAVERALARAQGRQRAASRSSFADRPDGADL